MKKQTLRKFFSATMLLLAGATLVNAQNVISTIAGTGISGFSGDGGPAVDARFANPYGVALDPSGNIYIADKSNNKVRMIDASSRNISTVAGSTYGLAGLGGPATLAKMKYPTGVFVNTSGNLVITDWFNDMAFYLDRTSGALRGHCGDGNQGCSGDGGHCLSARTMTPAGACQDLAGNTYLADYGCNKIRRIDGATGIITTIVNGTGSFGYTGDGGLGITAKLSRPTAVFVDPTSPGNGHLYISDAGNNVVRKLDMNTGIITTIAGTGVAGYSGNGGKAINAKLRNPGNLFIAADKSMYICDRGNHVIRKMNVERGIISTVVGNGTIGFSGDGEVPTFAQLNDPQGVWVDNSGRIYIADAGNQRIRMVAPLGDAGSATSPVTPKIESGVSNVLNAADVKVFPNPSNGVFTIATGTDYANSSVVISNVVGAQVYSTTLTDAKAEINLSSLPSGVYNVTLKSTTGTHTEKVTIK